MRLCRETVIKPSAIAGRMDCMIEKKTLKSKELVVKLKKTGRVFRLGIFLEFTAAHAPSSDASARNTADKAKDTPP